MDRRGEDRRDADADAADRRLLARITGRELAAFEALYRRYHPRLTRFLLNLTRRPPLVEEAVNDTMLAVWRAPERYNGASRVSTWLFAIAYRQGLAAMRRFDLPVEAAALEAAEDGAPGPEASAGRVLAAGRLDAAVAALPLAQRMVVELTYGQDLGYKEIAQVMDCPVDTVKTRMFHARRALRAALGGSASDWIEP